MINLHLQPLAKKDDPVQYDVPKNTHKRSLCDISFEVNCFKYLLNIY